MKELDWHSSYEQLPAIETPALIVSGDRDYFMPPRKSHEMADRMPNAAHLRAPRSTHFALLEHPEIVIPAVREFLDTQVRN